MRTVSVARVISMSAFVAITVLSTPAWAQSTSGNWELYPPSTYVYSTTVQQPINADGTSNFKANGKAVIPVKFGLAVAPGPVVFRSIGSDSNTDDDYSYLSFTPSTSLTFAQVTELKATYAFTEGNCHGGSLRWQVRITPTQAVFIYYGGVPNFTDCTTTNQSGVNMVGLTDLRYDTTQFAGGLFYDTYQHALDLLGPLPIMRASLVLDSGWGGDQAISPITNVTVNGNTFVSAGGNPVQTCTLPDASVQISKTSGTATGDVNEPVSIQPADNNALFRVVDCKYIYNLATSSLSGAGRYRVDVVIGGTPALGPAFFDLK